MALPHSPGRTSDLSSMAESDQSSHSTHADSSRRSSISRLAKKLVVGRNPFSSHGRKHSDEASIPPRTTSLALADSELAPVPPPKTPVTGSDQPISAISTVNSAETSAADASSSSIPATQDLAAGNDDPASDLMAPNLKALEQQRQELVDSVVQEVRRNKKAPLDEAGRRVFEAAGFGDRIEKKSDVEVETHWLKPVVQETIIHREHTEYTTVIEREIHIHHVYPRIQPIHDPDPIMLQPRHRMFSPRTGHWHEVIGDAEAISLLGEDAFLNGPKEYREIRRAALPGLDSSYNDQPDEIKQAGKARVIERETVEGGPTGLWHRLTGDSSSRSVVDDEVHLVDGLEGLGEGVRTMHVTI